MPARRFLALAALLSLSVTVGCGGGGGGGDENPPAATCSDGTQNGNETGVDCGGTTCVGEGKTCVDGTACLVASDCTSGYCNPSLACSTPSCTDGFTNQDETAPDCGGTICVGEGKNCADGLACLVASDCASNYCTPTQLCAMPSCTDAWTNGLETALNCGGGTCPDCANGLACLADTDCTSGFCNPSTRLCAAPTCSDTWKNGLETDVDCGGTTCVAAGKTCAAGFDCALTADCAGGLVCDPTTKTCATQCLANPAACTANEQCCAGFCDMTVPSDKHCADPVTCTGNGAACSFNTQCCTGYCDPSKFCGNPPVCRDLDAPCAANADCCDAYCNPSTRLCDTPVSACGATSSTCTANVDCCSSACNNPTGAPNAGTCTSTAFCKVAGAACLNSGECCSVDCVGGVCLEAACKATGTGCVTSTDCCTGICTGGLCQALPAPSGTSACTTLGDACNPAADTCCSKNCQGGKCIPAYLCHAPDDICYRDVDCCSGKCAFSFAGLPGRCLAPTGGDIQGGAPCDGPTTCVTRLCVDLGSGQTVCKPAGGCRMTGDYCNPSEFKTDTACTSGNYRTVCWPQYGDNSVCSAGFCTNPNGACCGGTPDAVDPGGYGVLCAPKQVGAPTLCSNGQSCNPPGNICGAAGDNASQNCCDGKKLVCKRDSQGIARCFGGCPNDDCSACPTGYDGGNPACCIPTDPGPSGNGNVCQFRDQCCGFVPCVPDANGILRCTAPTCTAEHDACTGEDDGRCCVGTTCTFDAGDLYPSDYTCERDAGCASTGNACTFNSDCCSNVCAGGVCGIPCASTGATCTFDGDCCAGLACNIPPGATRGTCESVSTCAPTNGSCNVDADCCNAPTEQCIDGACAEPATCIPQFASCTAATAGQCCAPTGCIEQDGAACAGGSTSCSCDQCSADGGSCNPSAADTGCCVGLLCVGSGSTGTCSSCRLAGDSCAASAECCPAASGPAFVCADVATGEACSGGVCACDTCLLSSQPCTFGGAPCCGQFGFCAAADGASDCAPGDTTCLCVSTGG
jgi:hypothetical protein